MEFAHHVLIFGKPQLGTPAMFGRSKPWLDLPQRVLAYADDSGRCM